MKSINTFLKISIYSLKIISCICILFISVNLSAQYSPLLSTNCQGIPFSELIRSTPGNIDFTFDNFSNYNGGITMSGATLLRLKVLPNNLSCKWVLRMFIDNNGGGTPVNEWETSFPYGVSGLKPTLDLIQVKIYNGCNTPINSGTYQNFVPTNGASIDIINDISLNAAGSCSTNVNGAGSYLTNYNEYSFTIDYRIIPGLTYAAGLYTLNIRFSLVEE